MMILSSYYYADDIPLWTEQLAQLNNSLEVYPSARSSIQDKNVLVIGSPPCLPEDKIMDILQEAGLTR